MLASGCRCVWSRLNFYQRPGCHGREKTPGITETVEDSFLSSFLVNIYLFKISNKKHRRRCELLLPPVLPLSLPLALPLGLPSTLHHIFHHYLAEAQIFHEHLVNCFANYQTRFFRARMVFVSKVLSRVVSLLTL